MRLAPFLSATALALVAVAASAQRHAPAQGNRLSGLSETLNGLSDDTNAMAAQAPPPDEAVTNAAATNAAEANTQEPVVAEPATTAPAEAQPVPPAPAPAPATPTRPPLVMPPEPLTRAQLTTLQAAAARGRLLGVIERAGRAATQDMLSRVSDPDGAGISGWIAEAEGNGVSVVFYANTDTGPVTVFRVTFNGGRMVDRDVHLAGTRPPLNPLEARMAAARAAAAHQDHHPCGSDEFNYFMVPPLTPDGNIDVYQISPQTQRGVYPLGGHFRTSVAPDGSIAETRGYTHACVNATVADPPAGARPAPITVTHLMDDLPQDIHAFLSAWTGHPLIVVAGDPQRLFAVTPEGIAEIPRQTPGQGR
jgi:hypothetical protein